jgi:hypothetical protein
VLQFLPSIPQLLTSVLNAKHFPAEFLLIPLLHVLMHEPKCKNILHKKPFEHEFDALASVPSSLLQFLASIPQLLMSVFNAKHFPALFLLIPLLHTLVQVPILLMFRK